MSPLPRVVQTFKEGEGQRSGIGCTTHARRFGNYPLIMRHMAIWEGNYHSCHRKSWV
jgi:hypothetical protein